MRRLFGLAILLSASQAEASSWHQIGGSRDGKTIIYADTETAKANGNVVSYWQKMVSPDFKDGSEFKLIDVKMDCDARTMSVLWIGSYDNKGNLVTSGDTSKYGVERIVPDSVQDNARTILCDPGILSKLQRR